MYMSGKVLFICNTYMQLITAVKIKQTIEREAADLLLSDHSRDSDLVAERLKKTELFCRVRAIKTKKLIYSQSKLEDAADVIRMTFGAVGKYTPLLWDDAAYSKIYYYNISPVVEAAYCLSLRNGVKPDCVCFEEGILSYNGMLQGPAGKRMKLFLKAHKLLRKENFRSETKEYTCYYPELFPDKSLFCRRVPHLSRDDIELKKLLNSIFDYNPAVDKYPQKYIFFGSSTDIDGHPVGETEMVLKIADLVGRENLLVKMHPRDGRDVYEKYGIAVSRNSATPWEVIQLNHDFSDHVFLTISSGSVLNASAMLGDVVTTYYLYPLVVGRNAVVDESGEDIGATVSALQKTGALQQMRIASALSQILE